MADNVLVDNGSNTDFTAATDDDGTAQHPYVKLEFGGDGTFTKVATGDPLPVTISGVATAALQTTLNGHVDGIETLIGTTNSTLTTIDGRVDTLESLIGTTNSTLTTIDGRVDTLESLIGTTNSTLTTIDGRVDGVEALLTTINTAVATVPKSATATARSLASGTSSAQFAASNSSRTGLTMTNTDANRCYVNVGATASSTAYIVYLEEGDYFELPYGLTGQVNAIWTSDGSGSLIGVEAT